MMASLIWLSESSFFIQCHVISRFSFRKENLPVPKKCVIVQNYIVRLDLLNLYFEEMTNPYFLPLSHRQSHSRCRPPPILQEEDLFVVASEDVVPLGEVHSTRPPELCQVRHFNPPNLNVVVRLEVVVT